MDAAFTQLVLQMYLDAPHHEPFCATGAFWHLPMHLASLCLASCHADKKQSQNAFAFFYMTSVPKFGIKSHLASSLLHIQPEMIKPTSVTCQKIRLQKKHNFLVWALLPTKWEYCWLQGLSHSLSVCIGIVFSQNFTFKALIKVLKASCLSLSFSSALQNCYWNYYHKQQKHSQISLHLPGRTFPQKIYVLNT